MLPPSCKFTGVRFALTYNQPYYCIFVHKRNFSNAVLKGPKLSSSVFSAVIFRSFPAEHSPNTMWIATVPTVFFLSRIVFVGPNLMLLVISCMLTRRAASMRRFRSLPPEVDAYLLRRVVAVLLMLVRQRWTLSSNRQRNILSASGLLGQVRLMFERPLRYGRCVFFCQAYTYVPAPLIKFSS